jgi:hypothetical protein
VSEHSGLENEGVLLLRHSLRLLPVLVLALLVGVFALSAVRQADARERSVHAVRVIPADAGLAREIHHYRRLTWRWQSVMGVGRTPATRAAVKDPSHRYKVWVRNMWKHRAKRARRLAAHPPHKAGWLCIHRHEGAWHDSGAPYYGGLQMDLGFQRTYGARLLRMKGTADRWTPLEQMWVAERAHRSGRGYYPWPNTARYCGLI